MDDATARTDASPEQVTHSRLRDLLFSLLAATTPRTSGDGATVTPERLSVMASALAGTERLRLAARSGDGTDSRRHCEPYLLVSTGRRWFL
ncbi:transcriptional regulator, partial [Streptomyces sp. SP17KL33]|nr:transcriptional regulator [Streptomyces sp. SP17KL33]